MNEKIKEMLYHAGFCVWDGEDYAPENAIVDWSSDYTSELNCFITDLITECANVAATATGSFKQQVYDSVVNRFITTDRNTNDFTPYEPSEIDEWESYDKDC
jgi:hypothetical protein